MQLKKFIQKDRYGNMMHIEFEPEANVPPVNEIPPMYDHPGEPKGTDTVPAWLTPGEFVVNKEATDIYGPIIKEMNDHGREIQSQMPQYAENGGMMVMPGLPMKRPDMYKLFTDEQRLPGKFDLEGVNFEKIDRYNDLIASTADRYNLDPNFLKAVLYTESGGNPSAVGDRKLKNKAFGLGQIRKNAYKDIKQDFPDYQFSLKNVQTNPVANIDATGKYLSMIENKYLPAANKGMKGFEKGSIDKLDQNQKENLMYQFYNAGPYSKSVPAVLNANKVMAVKNLLTGTSFPGEEKYQSPVKNVTEEGPSFLDKLMNIRFESGGNVPEPTYLAHGGVHLTNPSTWTSQHFNMKGPVGEIENEVVAKDTSIPKFENITKAENSPLGQLYTEDGSNNIPEIDSVYVPPKTVTKNKLPEGVADYTGEDRTVLETIFPKLYAGREQFGGQMTNTRGVPNPVQQAEQAFSMNEKTKDTFFPDIKLSKDGEPEAVNPNRISEETKKGIEDLYVKSGNKPRYDMQIDQYNKAVLQDKARKNWESIQQAEKDKVKAEKNQEKINQLENQKIPGNNSVNEKIDKEIDKIKGEDKTKGSGSIKSDRDQKIKDLWISTSGEKTPDSDSSDDEKVTQTKVIKKGQQGSEGQQKESESLIKSFFGDLLDTRELKRAAVIYLGSRLLGYSHNGSLRYIAKNYLDRVDTKAAARAKWIRDNATKYNPTSLKKFERTGDWSVLVRKGQIPRSTGDRKFFYDAMGKKRQALKYDITTPDGKTISYYSYDGGKSRVPTSHHDDAKSVPGSEEYNKIIRDKAPTVKNIIQENVTRYGETIKKTDKLGSKEKTYITNVLPGSDAMAIAKWSQDNGYDMTQLGPQIQVAYQMAIRDAIDKGKKPTTLIPYLKQLEIRNIARVPGLTEIQNEKGETIHKLDNDKFTTMNQEVLDFILPGNNNPKQQKEALQGFYGKLSQQFQNDPNIGQLLNTMPPGYTPFGWYLYNAIQINKARLAQVIPKT